MFRLAIFDWSGTLFDDCEQTYRANTAVFRHYGKAPLSYGEYRQKLRLPITKFYTENGIDAPAGEVVATFYKNLNGHHGFNLFPHAVELLRFLRHRGVKTALLTLQHDPALGEQLRIHNMEGAFDAVHGNISDKREEIHAVLAKFDFAPGEVLFIGDTPHDIEAARAAGIKIGVTTYGYTTREKLAAYKPDYYFDSLLEVEKLFE